MFSKSKMLFRGGDSLSPPNLSKSNMNSASPLRSVHKVMQTPKKGSKYFCFEKVKLEIVMKPLKRHEIVRNLLNRMLSLIRSNLS